MAEHHEPHRTFTATRRGRHAIVLLCCLASFSPSLFVSSFTPPLSLQRSTNKPTTSLYASSSLKPAAEPLMAAGKSLARTGEQLIAWTSTHDMYGGALSAVGANIRNAGDGVAQAAASCRFKTGHELVMDELRQAATGMEEAAVKLYQAVQELKDEDIVLVNQLEVIIQPVTDCAVALEGAGAAILQGAPVAHVGRYLMTAGQAMQDVQWPHLDDTTTCAFAEKIMLAGNNLQGVRPKRPMTGKSWLKASTVE